MDTWNQEDEAVFAELVMVSGRVFLPEVWEKTGNTFRLSMIDARLEANHNEVIKQRGIKWGLLPLVQQQPKL